MNDLNIKESFSTINLDLYNKTNKLVNTNSVLLYQINTFKLSK